MELAFDHLVLQRGDWSLIADGTFSRGVHLVTGNVGCGKSALAAYLAGLGNAVSGSIQKTGISTTMVSFQFPEYHITGATLAEECVSWGLDPGTILRSTGLESKRNCSPMRLSRGELKRFHLACIFENTYDLLVLDEPFSSLDIGEKLKICSILSRQSHGITIIFTHEQTIFPATDRIWEIRSGTLSDLGPLPGALLKWSGIPPLIQHLADDGKLPENITAEDLVEAGCRT